MIRDLLAIRSAPRVVQIVHRDCNVVRVAIRRAKDNRLLFGSTCCQQILEQILGHRDHTIRQQDAFFKCRLVVPFLQLSVRDRFACVRVRRMARQHIVNRDARIVQIYSTLLNLARRQVSILDPLHHRVFVRGLAKMPEIVRADFGVGFRFFRFLGENDLARRRRQSDLHRIGIAREDFRPLAPRRAMTFINDDVAEIVDGVILKEKIRGCFIRIYVERLIRRDQDARILLRLAA